MNRAGAALSALVRELGLDEALRLYRIKKSWSARMGEPLSLHTYPISLNKGRLTINIDSQAWLQQAGFFKAEITRKLSGMGVRTLSLRRGTVYPVDETKKDTPDTPPGEPDNEFIDAMLQSVEDPELKSSIRRAAQKAIIIDG